MLKIFIGLDPRQPVAYHVLCHSILRHASEPVSITPLVLDTLPITRKGLTEFTFSRYLAPYLCDYEGTSLFLDSDMLVTGDIAELFDYDEEWNDYKAVHVVPFEGPFKFERPSVMLFANELCTHLTPEYIDSPKTQPQSFDWSLEDNLQIGSLPDTWNYLEGYSEPTEITPKLIHYTQGVPGYKECRDTPFAHLWFEEYEMMLDHCSWLEIMGGSVHMESVLDRLKGVK